MIQVTVKTIARVVLKNHILTLLLAPPLVYMIYKNCAAQPPLRTQEETFGWVAFSMFVLGGVFEVVFWLGHYMEHLSPFLYRHFHLLHHTTKADTSISGYYMTFLDYCLEGPVPMLACTVVAAAIFNLSPTALLHQVMLNVVYAATVHSGWSIPGFPDPADHWLHHTKVAPGGQGINYGTHFNLMDELMGTHQAYESKD